MSAVAQVLAVVAVFREFGVPVTFEPGWENRGNGLTADYRGGIVHHTATGYSDRAPLVLRDGRPDLDGPLCQYAGLASGGIHVVCAHPANHAGASGGPRNGPFPVTTLFNRLVMGLEIVYPGVSPMTPAQYRTALVFAIAIRRLFGHSDYEWTRAHAETSREGKWDPGTTGNRTIDMDRFRRDAADLEASGGDDMPSIDEINWGLANFRILPNNRSLWDGVQQTLWNTEALIAGMAALANDQDITPEQMAEVLTRAVEEHAPKASDIAEAMAPAVVAAVVAALPKDADGNLAVDVNEQQIADEVLRSLGSRLSSGL